MDPNLKLNSFSFISFFILIFEYQCFQGKICLACKIKNSLKRDEEYFDVGDSFIPFLIL